MVKFILNGKEYRARELDFNAVCDMEEMGADLMHFAERPLSSVRSYVALNLGDKDLAGHEIQEHMAKGNTIEGLVLALQQSLEESTFFQSMKEEPESKPKKSSTVKSVK